jgi:hypothetical protein
MWSDVTWLMMPLLEYLEIGECGVVPRYFLILFTIAAAALTEQRIVSSNDIRVIVSIFLSFFCCLNVMTMQSANSSWGWSCLSCLVPVKKTDVAESHNFVSVLFGGLDFQVFTENHCQEDSHCGKLGCCSFKVDDFLFGNFTDD